MVFIRSKDIQPDTCGYSEKALVGKAAATESLALPAPPTKALNTTVADAINLNFNDTV